MVGGPRESENPRDGAPHPSVIGSVRVGPLGLAGRVAGPDRQGREAPTPDRLSLWGKRMGGGTIVLRDASAPCAGGYGVYLESNRLGRTFAHVPELPGCIVRGETAEQAIACTRDAIKQYQSWVLAHRGGLPRVRREARLRAVEQCSGGAASGSGSRVALLPADLPPVSRDELREYLSRMRYSREDLLGVVSEVGNDLLGLRPTRRQRTIREILRHVAGAEQWYVTRIMRMPRFRPQKDPLERLRIVREAADRALSRQDLRRSGRIVERAGEPWTLRKVLRRFLEHEREHLLEIEWCMRAAGRPVFPGWMDGPARRRELRLAEAFQFR